MVRVLNRCSGMAASLRGMMSLGKTIISIVFPLIILAGCQFIDLGSDLEEMEGLSSIQGSILQDEPGDDPIAVALFSEEMSRDQVIDAKLIESQEFQFTVPPGNYFIFAFEDINGDFDYQPGEPAGHFGDPSAIAIGADTEQIAIEVTLYREFKLADAGGDKPKTAKENDEHLPKLWRGRANIGEIKELDDPRFDEGLGKVGMWQPLRFSIEAGPGLFMLEAYDPNKVPIVFVHGIGGSPRIWRDVIDGLDRQRFQPWVLSYASGLPLDANADYLFEALTQLQITHGFEAFYLVAHSMGGLVSQAFINRDHAWISRHLELFVTLGTPWGGHDAAKLGVDYAPAVVPAWRDMVPRSDLLTGLRDRSLPEDLPYHLLFAYNGNSLVSSEPNDGTVTIASQLDHVAQKRASKVYGFDTDHSGIVSDETAIELLNELFDQTDRRTSQELITAQN